MPKRPVDKGQMTGFRIELQEKERDLLQLFLVGKTVTNGAQALAPVLAAIAGPLAAVWAAQFTADEIKSWLDNQVGKTRETFVEPYLPAYEGVASVLATKNWDDFTDDERYSIMESQINAVMSVDYGYSSDLDQLRNMAGRFLALYKNNASNRATAQGQGWAPADAWAEFYPADEFENDLIYARKSTFLGTGTLWGQFVVERVFGLF